LTLHWPEGPGFVQYALGTQSASLAHDWLHVSLFGLQAKFALQAVAQQICVPAPVCWQLPLLQSSFPEHALPRPSTGVQVEPEQ
jgi:hypothetical protein